MARKPAPQASRKRTAAPAGEHEPQGVGYERIDLYDAKGIRRISGHYGDILKAIGEDPRREGLKKTPERVAKALQYLTPGYDLDPAEYGLISLSNYLPDSMVKCDQLGNGFLALLIEPEPTSAVVAKDFVIVLDKSGTISFKSFAW